MANEITTALSELGEHDLYTHDYAIALQSIEAPDEAVAWLVACAIDVETTVVPPTYVTALNSRFSNIVFGLKNLKDLSEPGKKSKLWHNAAYRSRALSSSDYEETSSFIASLKELNE